MLTIPLVVSALISAYLGMRLARVYRDRHPARIDHRLDVKTRFSIDYRDMSDTGEWCSFDTREQAAEAVTALNDAYAGEKRFWLHGALDPEAEPTEAPAEIAERPTPLPRPHARPKPGTPIVRQRAGKWFVSDGMFEIGYGSGEAGYRAALAAVERAHKA